MRLVDVGERHREGMCSGGGGVKWVLMRWRVVWWWCLRRRVRMDLDLDLGGGSLFWVLRDLEIGERERGRGVRRVAAVVVVTVFTVPMVELV